MNLYFSEKHIDKWTRFGFPLGEYTCAPNFFVFFYQAPCDMNIIPLITTSIVVEKELHQ